MSTAAAVAAQQTNQEVQAYSRFYLLQQANTIDVEDIRGLGKIELFSVIAEHWSKCTIAVKIRLMCHQDHFVRGEAIAQGKAFSTSQICAE